MNPIDVERVALWWGPGILVLVIFGYGFMRLAHYWIEKTMEVKRQQTDSAYGVVRQYIEQYLTSQSSQADALSRLANSVEHRESLESFEHQEILIALKAMHRDFNGLHCRYSASPCSVREPSKLLRAQAGDEGRRLKAPAAARPGLAPGEMPPEPDKVRREVAWTGAGSPKTASLRGQPALEAPGPRPRIFSRPLAAGFVKTPRRAAAAPPAREERVTAADVPDPEGEAATVGPRSIHPFAGNTYIKNISLGVK